MTVTCRGRGVLHGRVGDGVLEELQDGERVLPAELRGDESAVVEESVCWRRNPWLKREGESF